METWLKVGEAAAMLHVSPSTLRRWADSGADSGLFTVDRVGPRRDRRILKTDLHKVIAHMAGGDIA